MSNAPLSKDGAKTKLNRCFEEGAVMYSRHFRDELANDDLTTQDVLAVCRSGAIIMAPEKDIRTGQCSSLCSRGRKMVDECTNCGGQVTLERRNYRYTESGISNVVLQNIEIAECSKCGNSDAIIPRIAKIHRAIAQALMSSPVRLTGEQLRFLRKHLGLSGDQLGRYLHTDKTKISKWERGEDRIGPATDRLVRLLVAALDSELRPGVSAVADHLPEISDESGKVWELHVDVVTLQTTFSAVSRAA